MENIRANIGEWSEIYTLIKLLKDGRIYAADEQLQHLASEQYFPIIRIRREEEKGSIYDYYTASNDESVVKVYHNGQYIKSMSVEDFDEAALYMYHKLATAGNGGLELSQLGNLKSLLADMNVNKVKAGSKEKADIVMEIFDVNTGYNPVAGFSIKSQLGSAPTLLNASKATNFVYRLEGINESVKDHINSIDTKKKIIDRLQYLVSTGASLSFCEMYDGVFKDNLEMIDSLLPEILAYVLLYRYRDNIVDCKDIVAKLCEENPMHYHNPKIYGYKFKKFLCAIALGMVPSKIWDGIDEANGGYIVVKKDGDVVAYYIYNRNAFEQYLLNTTKLEAASTSRHDYASVYQKEDGFYMNLNLQIRFKA